jgi:hypothetical protein
MTPERIVPFCAFKQRVKTWLMSYEQADKTGVSRGKFNPDQRSETAAKDECRLAGEGSDQPRRIIGVRGDLVSLCPDWRAAGQSAAVIRHDTKIAGKLIGQGFRTIGVTGAALEDQ